MRDRFGPETGAVLRRVKRLNNEMYARGPDAFRAAHPELSAAAVKALTWCHTFDTRLKELTRQRSG